MKLEEFSQDDFERARFSHIPAFQELSQSRDESTMKKEPDGHA